MAQWVKNLPAMQEVQETQFQSLDWEDPLEKEMQPTPVILPETSHGQRSLVGYSSKGKKESSADDYVNEFIAHNTCQLTGLFCFLLPVLHWWWCLVPKLCPTLLQPHAL